jgi:hypothetical protein
LNAHVIHGSPTYSHSGRIEETIAKKSIFARFWGGNFPLHLAAIHISPMLVSAAA